MTESKPTQLTGLQRMLLAGVVQHAESLPGKVSRLLVADEAEAVATATSLIGAMPGGSLRADGKDLIVTHANGHQVHVRVHDESVASPQPPDTKLKSEARPPVKSVHEVWSQDDGWCRALGTHLCWTRGYTAPFAGDLTPELLTPEYLREARYSPAGTLTLYIDGSHAVAWNDETECNCDPMSNTGGGHSMTCPEFEPECTCYEALNGHMPGCPMRGSVPRPKLNSDARIFAPTVTVGPPPDAKSYVTVGTPPNQRTLMELEASERSRNLTLDPRPLLDMKDDP